MRSNHASRGPGLSASTTGRITRTISVPRAAADSSIVVVLDCRIESKSGGQNLPPVVLQESRYSFLAGGNTFERH